MNGQSQFFIQHCFPIFTRNFRICLRNPGPSEQFAEQLPIGFNWENKRSNSANAGYDGSTEQKI